MQYLEIWKFLAGLGFFLYGMRQLETVLKSISGRPIKLFLKRNTQNIFKSVSGGALVTAIVQSSTVVSLIVLAFIEAKVISFRNALGVILGANVGTTVTGWIVVLIGFKLDVIGYALPVIAVTTFGMYFSEKRKTLHNLFSALFSIGILFLGLGLMKEGGQQIVSQFDIAPYAQSGTFLFIIIGLLLTSIIQSSSATVALTLTALHAGIIDFSSAASIVIGSEVGTTLTILVWGVKGSADKKRAAWGNFCFNIFTSSLAYILLPWLIYSTIHLARITDPLYGLVFFQTIINCLSVLIFIPFISYFSKWLENRFASESETGSSYIGKYLPLLPILAVDAFRNEAETLLDKTVLFIESVLRFENETVGGLLVRLKSFTQQQPGILDEYHRLKQTEGFILQYYIRIQDSSLTEEDSARMLQYLMSIRQSIYAAKAIKDIAHNLKEYESSANETLHQQCSVIWNEWKEFLVCLKPLLSQENHHGVLAEQLGKEATDMKHALNTAVMLSLKNNQLNELEASTLINVHEELLTCKEAIILAVHHLKSGFSATNGV